VKRPDTPEPLEVEDLIDKQEQQKQLQNQPPNPQATPVPTPAPKVEQPKQMLEDLQMKKALEILQDKANAAKAGSGE
jgi:hypothetical protein